ncbi:MAG TPA: heterodisulfide reductase-related iron-sulfur binding cluster [Acidimicrobiia bacterium]|jgi:Fe-S oxidoreductase
MTTTYDPHDDAYLDASDARVERDRVFELCHGCRLCWNLCPSFGSLFELIDDVVDGDVAALSGVHHDRIVGECYQCKLCAVKCPYVPPHEWQLDFPRLMLRSLAVQRREGKVPRSADVLARTDLQGKVATAVAPVVNRLARLPVARDVMQRMVGIGKDRLLPSFAGTRFSAWFTKRAGETRPAGAGQSRVALFPTCLVEYQAPEVGRALVHVYEHNGVSCELPDGQVCCGMPWLDAGDVERFVAGARHNVDVLTSQVDQGMKVVVPQPTCAYVLKREYPEYLRTDEARRVADATRDAHQYLMELHRDGRLDTEFTGARYDTISWHAACHIRAQQMGAPARDLLALTGARVERVERCSAIDGTWGLRAENVELARKVAAPLFDAVARSGTELVTGDCHLANTAIEEATGRRPVHPLQVLARAYGIEEGTP